VGACRQNPAHRQPPTRVEAGEDHDGARRSGQPLEHVMHIASQGGDIAPEADDVVAAGGEAHQRRRHRLCLGQLLVPDLLQTPAANSQVRITEVGTLRGQLCRDQIGPAAIGAVVADIVQTFGEAVPQGDKTVEHLVLPAQDPRCPAPTKIIANVNAVNGNSYCAGLCLV
jgi:hypothetical protein